KPVVAGRDGGPADTLLDGVTGDLVDGASAAELKELLGRLLRDPRRLRTMGRAAHCWVARRFPWRRVAEEYRRIVDDAVG
ncbi:MAG: glycosyltransferase, partial [Planctomycetia bacterium]